MRFRVSLRSLAMLLLILSAALSPRGAGAAENWPARPITLVVSFAPGAIMDFVGRLLAQDLTTALGQPVVVENKPGGGGVSAAVSVAKAPADGYMLLMTAIGPAVLRPIMDSKLPYNVDTDFTPVILTGDSPNVLIASPKSTFATVQAVVDFAKRNSGKLNVAHSGPGTMGHLIGALFASEAGIDVNLVAYRGSAPMVTDLLGGQIDVGFPAFGPETHAARVVAVTTAERVDFLPGVPTMSESGFPRLVGSTWNAVLAPAGVSADVVTKLNSAIDAFLRKEETRKKFEAVGFRGLGGPPERLRQQIAEDRAKWSKVIAAAGITGGQ